MKIQFEWDPSKAKSNLRKHGVRFDEAGTVFDDPLAVIFDDELHSEDQHREIIIGHSTTNRLMLVCFVQMSDNSVRIISARPATRREREDYEKNCEA